MSNTYFVKIDGKGNVLSDVFTLSEKLLTDYGYTDAIVQVDFDVLKNGLTTRLYSQTQRKYIYLTVDFENEPKVETPNRNNLDSLEEVPVEEVN